MSRNNKSAKRHAQAKVITAMHQRGEKGPAKTKPMHTKTNAWWQKFGTYAEFTKGAAKKGKDA
jgi:hypothetical protein